MAVTNENALWGDARQAVALKYWSSMQLDAVAVAIATALSSWNQAWAILNLMEAEGVQCVNAGAGDSTVLEFGGWHPMHLDNADNVARAWLHCTTEQGVGTSTLSLALRTLREALFGKASKVNVLSAGGTASTDIAGEIAEAAWRDLQTRLRAVLRMPEVSPASTTEQVLPAHDRKPWSGAVQITFPWCGALFHLHLNAACMESIAPVRPAAAVGAGLQDQRKEAPLSVLQAVEHEVLSVSAEMASLEISIGDLQSLHVNDVILFPHRLDEPILVKMENGGTLAAGFLGKSRGNWAVELEVSAADQLQPADTKSFSK